MFFFYGNVVSIQINVSFSTSCFNRLIKHYITTFILIKNSKKKINIDFTGYIVLLGLDYRGFYFFP